ncbi:MAG: 2-dehydro-3-deoxygalactonokinase [Sphingomonadaceae bacterium]|nr:2-dehydro-3-deoxygalactonokinase [Sphingomonadaceae bacterium]
MPQGSWIAVDWGTTNRRAYRIGRGGGVEERLSDHRGTLSIAAGGFSAAAAELRSRLGDHPLLLAGMVGSNRGWREVPYVAAPAGVEEVASGVLHLPEESAFLVPGVRQHEDDRPDVMRGEEVQLLGAVAAGLVPGDARICHPGTHAKWARIEAERVSGFRTIMTGELFATLRQHGILAPQLQAEVAIGDPFRGGVRHGLGHDDLTAELFTIRARLLTATLREEDAASYASGLLIGTDVRIGLAFLGDPEREIALIGASALTDLYRAALSEAGRPARCIDGEEAFVAGARALAEVLL